jgi:hypothetical protein
MATKTKTKRRHPKPSVSSGPFPSWEQRFQELESFKEAHGHCNVSTLDRLNPTLGRWVANVRKAKKRGTLAEERVRRLDALGFSWELRPPPAISWQQHVNDLKEFKKKRGHCDVPHRYEPNQGLGYWVAETRKRKKQGEQHTTLSSE